jgi:hypothetical protein
MESSWRSHSALDFPAGAAELAPCALVVPRAHAALGSCRATIGNKKGPVCAQKLPGAWPGFPTQARARGARSWGRGGGESRTSPSLQRSLMPLIFTLMPLLVHVSLLCPGGPPEAARRRTGKTPPPPFFCPAQSTPLWGQRKVLPLSTPGDPCPYGLMGQSNNCHVERDPAQALRRPRAPLSYFLGAQHYARLGACQPHGP